MNLFYMKEKHELCSLLGPGVRCGLAPLLKLERRRENGALLERERKHELQPLLELD